MLLAMGIALSFVYCLVINVVMGQLSQVLARNETISVLGISSHLKY